MADQGRRAPSLLIMLLISYLISSGIRCKFARLELSPRGGCSDGKGSDQKTTYKTMTKKMIENVREEYAAPAIIALPFFSESAICDVSINGNGDIDDGVGVDWGELDD